jgi:hypothetical protein
MGWNPIQLYDQYVANVIVSSFIFLEHDSQHRTIVLVKVCGLNQMVILVTKPLLSSFGFGEMNLKPGPATNMLFLQIYQKYFIIEQT